MRLKELLAGKLTGAELQLAPSGFDVIGDIALLELKPQLLPKARVVAEAITRLQKSVKVVALKMSGRKGQLRLQKLKIIFGQRRYATVHTESGLRIALNVAKCYFSPRLASERLRIASLVKPGERVLVMFSGVCSYALVIAKHSAAAEIVGVEKNPTAHRYAVENVSLNRLGARIKLYLGDVRDVVPRLGKFDRIVMPLPKSGKAYLDTALTAAKAGTVLHYYGFGSSPEQLWSEVAKACRGCLLGARRVGSYAPGISRFCLDIEVREGCSKE